MWKFSETWGASNKTHWDIKAGGSARIRGLEGGVVKVSGRGRQVVREAEEEK